MSCGVWRNTPRFVGKKRVKKEVWIAIDRATRDELKKRFHVGGRGREEARKFWQSLPPVYRSGCCSTPNVQLWMGCCSTPSDKWEAYQGLIPSNRHRIVEKNKRETNHVERY